MTTDLLLRRTRMHFPRVDLDNVKIVPIERGGSDRRFYRICCSPDQTLILVKYNLEREENRHYVEIAQFLAEHDIRTPKIYYHDPEEGLIWIEDLGDRDLFSYRDETWLVRRAFYEAALDEILKLHRLPESVCEEMRERLPAEFNAALYLWEQSYFFENCLGCYFKVDGARVAALAALPRLLVHRDFQSQNIMMRNGQAHLIDFQGMRPGLAQYDLASLLYDPYVDLNEAERDELLAYYCGGEVTDDFRETLQLCAMQRLMQALGAYGFLGLVKGHKHFLDHIPAAMESLCAIVSARAGLDELAECVCELGQKRIR